MANELLSLAYDDIDEKTAARLRQCAEHLTFAVKPDGKKTLINTWFCRVRLCPVCTWRRALKVGAQMHQIMKAIAKEHDYKYIFLTLTQRNCKGSKLSANITRLLKAYSTLTQTKAFKGVSLGWYRALEVTHNVDYDSKDFDTYHPHIHAVIAVKASYFTSRDYIKQATWADLWQHALGVDYTPIVDVRRIKGNDTAAVAEAAKYGVKSGDYIITDDWDLTIDTVRLLDAALRNRRFIAYGGLLKEIHKQLHLDKPDDGDFVHITDDAAEKVAELPTISYAWHSGYRQYRKD